MNGELRLRKAYSKSIDKLNNCPRPMIFSLTDRLRKYQIPELLDQCKGELNDDLLSTSD